MAKNWIKLVFLTLLNLACQPDVKRPLPNYEDYTKHFTLLSPDKTGIDFQNTIIEDEKNNHLVNDMFVAGAGVAVGDINNDNLPDIFLAGNQVPDKLYLNQGNFKFQDISMSAGIEQGDHTWSAGVTMADVNHDGLLDIYVCKSVQGKMQLSNNLLYINNGDLTFTEKGKEMGLADRGYSVQATFFDYDLDGYLDVYIANQPPSLGKRRGEIRYLLNPDTEKFSDRLYRNNGNGTFTDVTQNAGLLSFGYSLSATVSDYNDDGWPDIYVTNDYDRPDLLYINQQDATFKNLINQSMKHISNFSMGSDAADFDNDGLIDIIAVDMVAEDHKRIKTYMGGMSPESFWKIVNNGWHYQYMFNTLQKNNGNGTYSEVAQIAGVSNTDWSWGPLFADFDNDGWKDLFVTNGIKRNQRHSDLNELYSKKLDSLEEVARRQEKDLYEVIDVMDFVTMAPIDRLDNFAFKNNGNLTFTKVIKDWGLDFPGLAFGASYADLDADGDLDLVVNNMDDHAFIYQNNTIENSKGNYLRVKVSNDVGTPAYGARVRLYQGGQLWQMQELVNSRGYMSKSDDILLFGLGKKDQIERIEITWHGNKKMILTEVQANQTLELRSTDAESYTPEFNRFVRPFKDVASQLNIDFRHQENDFNDFNREGLLPHKMSNFGPGLATGDVNGDGLEDFYVGGAAGFPGTLYIQSIEGTFEKSFQEAWIQDQKHEDLGAELFDCDQDGDLDLYVVSGGNEFDPDDERLQDRLYLNNGSGSFSRGIDHLPIMLNSGSRVYTNDYDQDGDLDLFVGGRLIPGKYPYPAKSYILNNNRGKFSDVTETVAPFLLKAGLVTSASWADFNGDGSTDLVLVGEWMAVTLLENNDGIFTNVTEQYGLQNSTGWYYSILDADIDQDGDIDFIVGNLGLNYKYKASEEEPFEIYTGDFDDNGVLDIVLGYHEHGELFPVRGRSCSSEQMPFVKEKFPTFEDFGNANLFDIYGESLDEALHYQATTFASGIIENLGDGSFKMRPFPNEAQLSSINNIIVKDFTNDGNLDLLMSGNLYPAEIETPRNDGNMGLFLTGDGKGNFEIVPVRHSGFFAPHDAKDMKLITVGSGKNKKEVILVANNKYWLQAIQHDPSANYNL